MAANANAKKITPEILQQGLRASEEDLLRQAALTAQEERIRQLLQQKGNLSDENITLDDLTFLGCSGFHEIIPFLERLEEQDLAQRSPELDAIAYTPILLPSVDQ